MKLSRGLALLALALAAMPAVARAGVTSFSAEAFGGMVVPILQDDSDQGTVFGARLPVHLLPLLTLEPWYSKSALGDKSVTIAGLDYQRDGGEVRAYGLNLRLGGASAPGLSFFPYAGIGSYRITRSGSAEIDEAGYSLGAGLALTPVPKVGIGLRGQFDMVPIDGASRKYTEIQLGLSYTFLSLP